MAVSIHLKQFDGPLDLLLQLVGKARIELKDIFVSEITEQYIEIVRNAPDFDMDEASEFISMAALLLEIKSRHLLPKPPKEEPEEEDPEAALLARLEAYRRFKEGAADMARFEKDARELFGKLPEEYPVPPPAFELEGLTLDALWEAIVRVKQRKAEEVKEPIFSRFREIRRDNYTVEGMMEFIGSRLQLGPTGFDRLLSDEPDREEVVTLFLAVLEMLKQGKMHIVQNKTFESILLLPGGVTYDAEDESGSDGEPEPRRGRARH